MSATFWTVLVTSINQKKPVLLGTCQFAGGLVLPAAVHPVTRGRAVAPPLLCRRRTLYTRSPLRLLLLAGA
jgi:hypothetical protein